MGRVANTFEIPGSVLVQCTMDWFCRNRDLLRSEGRAELSDLLPLSHEGHVSVEFRVAPRVDSVVVAFSYDVSEEDYGKATGQDRCARCREWSVFCKDLEQGPVCDYCRGKASGNEKP